MKSVRCQVIHAPDGGANGAICVVVGSSSFGSGLGFGVLCSKLLGHVRQLAQIPPSDAVLAHCCHASRWYTILKVHTTISS